jgi:hypothetical protein
MGQRYAYGNAREIPRERLRTLETLLDAGSRRVLEPFVAPRVALPRGRRRVRPDPPATRARLADRRPRALERLVAALEPGGVLVAEEMDFGSVAPRSAPRGRGGLRARGGGAGGDIWRLTLVQLRDEMDVAAGDVDRVLELCDDPAFRSVSPIRDGGNVNCGIEGSAVVWVSSHCSRRAR